MSSKSCLLVVALSAASSLMLLSGCASSSNKSTGMATEAGSPNRFVATDGRVVEIGKSAPAEGGRRYENPHLEKGKCWVASGFDFNGYDTLYLAPTTSTAKFPDKPEDQAVHQLAKENLVIELARTIETRQIFPKVVTRESDIKPEAKVLKLENTITEFSKGGGGARYFVGLYGGGQPVLRVDGKMSEGTKTLFKFEGRRSGTSAGARMSGVFMKDEDIQLQDIRSLVLDVTDFMAVIAGKYQTKN